MKKNSAKDSKEKAPAAVDDLPHLEAYDKTYFYSFSIPDLLVDILLIVFSTLISHQFFSTSGLFFHLQTWQIIAMYGIVVLTVPWYLGYIYVKNSAYYGGNVMRVFLWIFILMVLMVLVYMIRLVFASDWVGDNFSGITAFTGVFSVFLLVLGPMMCIGGSSAAYSEFKKKQQGDDSFSMEDASVTGVMFIIILAVGLMIYIIGLFPPNSSFWVVMLGYLGGPILAVIIYGLCMAFLSYLNKIGVYKFLSTIAQTTFPFFIISVLVFWSGVAIYFMQNDFAGGGKLSMSGMIFSVCVSGLVPFRIIMMFNAPLRITHIGLGILSLSYFLWNLFALTR